MCQDLLLYLRRKYVDATHDHHVVVSACNLGHTAHRACRARQQTGQVAGAVAYDRRCLLGQGSQNKLARFSIGQDFASFGIDDFGIKVILPKGQTVLGFDALLGNPRPNNLRQTIDIDRIDIESGLDILSHGLGPGLCPKNTDFERGLPRIQACCLKGIGNIQAVGWSHHDDARFEIVDQLHLLFGLPPGHWYHSGAQFFHAKVRPQAAREQAIAVTDMNQVVPTPSGSPD